MPLYHNIVSIVTFLAGLSVSSVDDRHFRLRVGDYIFVTSGQCSNDDEVSTVESSQDEQVFRVAAIAFSPVNTVVPTAVVCNKSNRPSPPWQIVPHHGRGSKLEKKVDVISYRSFTNSDPPSLVRLWHSCGLGRAAAEHFPVDVFDECIFAQRYFDRRGVIVALDDDRRIVGFVHATPQVLPDLTLCDENCGLICAVMVHPEFRRQGIGRELVRRAEAYLAEKGLTQVVAGPPADEAPYYFGLYGGVQPDGFFLSDAAADPFFTALGYEPVRRIQVYQRQLPGVAGVIDFRLQTLRRKLELVLSESTEQDRGWWVTRYGRLETLRCDLVPKAGGEPVASVSLSGLDLYVTKWNERAIGLSDLQVYEQEHAQQLATILLMDLGKRMQQEMVTRLEIHADEADERLSAVLESAGFSVQDTGIVYRRGKSLS